MPETVVVTAEQALRRLRVARARLTAADLLIEWVEAEAAWDTALKNRLLDLYQVALLDEADALRSVETAKH